MARQKSKARQQEDLHQTLLSISFIIPSILVFLLSGSMKAAAIVGGICLVMGLSLVVFIMKSRQERLKRSEISEIDTMDVIQVTTD